MIFLSFGRVSDASAARAAEGKLVASRGGGLGRQVALFGAQTPAFRLNSRGWMTVAPGLVAALDTRAKLRMLCRDRLMAASPPFAARARRVVAAYLDRAEQLAGPPPERPEAVTHPTDRFFETLLPMPNAHVQPVTAAGSELVPVAGHNPVRVDLAFWDGETLHAILFGGAGSRMPQQARALAGLKQALAERISIRDIEGSGQFDLETILPKTVFAAPDGKSALIYGPYRAPEFHVDLP